jgi:transglutaminase-like putative cysteine protease
MDGMNTQTQDIQNYLVATPMCDSDDPWLQRTAKEIIGDTNIPEEKALRIFYFVRDGIRFGLAFSRTKASQTLRRGYGECSSKTNVQVALLRAVRIPARLRWVKAESRTLRGLVMDSLNKRMPPTASHFWPECYIGNKWISCGAFLDKTLYEGMFRKGLITKKQVPTIDWDGKTDLIVLAPWIVEDCGSLSSVDEALEMIQYSEEGMPPI